MQYSTNFNMNKPERADQYNLDHWNQNTDIIDDELNALQNITDQTFKTALLNFCYPIGSLYWSSNSANPSTLFGGTWTQIKDKFVWAKGDNDIVNATGGAKTISLIIDNLPSHTHSIGAHNHGLNNHTHTFSHTHEYTPDGNVNWSDWATITLNTTTASDVQIAPIRTNNDYETNSIGKRAVTSSSFTALSMTKITGSNIYNQKLKTNRSSNSFKFTGTAGTTTSQSESTTSQASGNTADSTVFDSGSTGSGTAIDKMPPYIVKYCWERIA